VKDFEHSDQFVQQFSQVFLLSFAMFLSTFLIAISVPYLASEKEFSPRQQKPSRFENFVSRFGAGLMVGAALFIIIPEGILVLLNSYIKREASSAESPDFEDPDSELLQKNAIFDSEEAGKTMGCALGGGFILMVVIDKLSHMVQDVWSKEEVNSCLEYSQLEQDDPDQVGRRDARTARQIHACRNLE